jgi:hypothetical protein
MTRDLRDNMMLLLGQIEAIRYPFVWNGDNVSQQAYYDLIDSIKSQYIKILGELWGYSEE